jgi:plastocyanin
METKIPRFSGEERPLSGHARVAFHAARRLAGSASYAAALLALPAMALAAGGSITLKGRIAGGNKLVNPVWTEGKDPALHRFTFREPSTTVRLDVRTTLTGNLHKELCIAALGAEKSPTPKTPLRVKILGGRTDPVTLVVAEGQQIQFENLDPFPHKIYDVGNKGLTAVETGAAKSRTWTPPAAGKYEIRDQTTPSVRSWIVVEPRLVAVAFPDRKGEFAVDLDPGKYKLRGYFNGEPVGTELDAAVNATPADQTLKAPLVVGESDKAGG